jgi:protein-disulfide isomerase
VVVRFNDYQCAPCRISRAEYRGVIETINTEHPGSVRLVSFDYPLETECNRHVATDVHPAACDAAVAVRLARAKGRGSEFEEWVWSHQGTLSPQTVRQAALTIGEVRDLDLQYQAVLDQVRADVEIGHRLGVSGTPTFFVNGVRLPPIPRAEFESAIRLELRRTLRSPGDAR